MAAFVTDAFNGVMGGFLEQLVIAFPREDSIKDALAGFKAMATSKKAEVRDTPRLMFMNGVRPHMQQIRARDDDYMAEHMDSIEFISGLGLKKYWVSEHMPAATRESIWTHLNQLLMLGSTIENVPPEVLPMVGDIYESMMASGGFGDASASADGSGAPGAPGAPPDMAKMMQTMMKKFQSGEFPGAQGAVPKRPVGIPKGPSLKSSARPKGPSAKRGRR